MQRSEGGLDARALLRVVAQPRLGALLQAVDAGQDLLLQVVDLTLEQLLQAVRLHRAVVATELL